jgi:hypothetical protein
VPIARLPKLKEVLLSCATGPSTGCEPGGRLKIAGGTSVFGLRIDAREPSAGETL